MSAKYSLDTLIKKIEDAEKARSLSDDYLLENGHSTREEVGIGEYSYGIIMVPEEWVLPYLKEYKKLLDKE